MAHTLFAYLNIRNPFVAWEVAIGRVRSVTDATHESFGLSAWAYSLLRKYAKAGADRRFVNELLLESARQLNHADSCSRLADLYLFENEYDAHAALERWNLTGMREYISPVQFSARKLSKHDSEWITAYLSSEEQDWIPRYWRGETLGAKPLTEVLACGIGAVMNRQLRHAAYQSILERWPSSTPLLSMACCAFAEYGLEDIALLRPAILESEGTIRGSHFIDMRDLDLHQDKVMKALTACKARGEAPPMIVPDDGVNFFRLPDFSSMNFVLQYAPAAEKLRSMRHGADA